MALGPAGWVAWLRDRLPRRVIQFADEAEQRPEGGAVPFPVERRPIRLADLAPEQLRELIEELNGRAYEVGCAVFGGDTPSDRVVVIFAGNLERFQMLSVARHLSCPVILLQDVQSWWYGGSCLLPDLDRLCREFLVPEIGTARALLFGQSSGAYAALAASTYMPGSTVVACSPQTFSDAEAKARFCFVGVRALSTPPGLIDLRTLLDGSPDPNGFRAVIMAASEAHNPVCKHFWMDYMHVLRLVEVYGINIFVVNCANHAVVHHNAKEFGELISGLVPLVCGPSAEKLEFMTAELARIFGPSVSGESS